MNIDSEEISDYIKALVEGVTEGVPVGYFLSSPIKIDIAINNKGESDGSIKLMIAGVGGKRSSEQNARVQIEVINPISEEVKKLFENAIKNVTNKITN